MKCAILFKIYYWDKDVEFLFNLLKKKNSSCDIFIVRDVTISKCLIPPEYEEYIFDVNIYEIEKLGLPTEGGFYDNSDYAEILFYLKNLDYEFYVPIEHDCASFVDIAYIVQEMNDCGIDIVYYPQPIDITYWPHKWKNIPYFKDEDIVAAYVCIHFASRKFLNFLALERLVESTQKLKNNIPHWPYGEAVIGSICNKYGLNYKNMQDFCSPLYNYSWKNSLTVDSLSRINTENNIIHPVSNIQKCIRTNLGDVTKLNIDLLRRLVIINDFKLYCHAYHLENNSDSDRLLIFSEAKKNLVSNDENKFLFSKILTLDCVASQSSYSKYSSSREESYRALNIFPRGRNSIHTEYEEGPWFMAEFNSYTFVSYIYIFDREDVFRSSNMFVEVGVKDGERRIVFENKSHQKIGGLNSGPLIIEVSLHIKWLKVALYDHGIINLDSVIAI